MVDLPADLRGPVPLALARAGEDLPAPGALPGGCVYELKWDGYRAAVVRTPAGARLWSRQGTDLTGAFPDLAAAAAALPPGCVLDGEVVIWHQDRLDFDLLGRRLGASRRRVAAQVAAHPASYVAFDLLAADGADLRGRPLSERRAALEDLAATWAPPLQLSPATTDPDLAARWATDYRAAGIEGLVAKGAATRYVPGRRGWVKVKSRQTEEVIVGAVLGPLRAPVAVVLGRYRGERLVIVGHSVPLTRAQAAALGARLTPDGPGHPWPDRVRLSRFGADREPARLTRVAPQVVAEVSADTARTDGVFRHPVRFVRVRPELTAADVPALPARG